jgi:hypothetical protein
VTSASISRNVNVPTVESYYTPYNAGSDVGVNGEIMDDAVHSPTSMGDGLATFSGEITFELTNGMMDFVFNPGLYSRKALFSVQFYDGSKSCTVYNCSWTSITITGNPNSLVTVSISYQSNNGYSWGLMISDTDFRAGQYYDSSIFHIPYWQTGGEDIEEFSINFSRSVSSVFLNCDTSVPAYLRPGIMQVTLNATTAKWKEYSGSGMAINVGRKRIVIPGGFMSSATYNMSSMTDIGRKTYSWQGLGSSNTSKQVRFVDRGVSNSGSV